MSSPGVPIRCPECGAAVRPGTPWCTLCYRDLREPEPQQPVTVAPPGSAPPGGQVLAEPAPVPAAPAGPPGLVAPSAPTAHAEHSPGTGTGTGTGNSTATWPCAGCGSAVSMDLDVCPSCGLTFLGGLHAAEQPRHPALARLSSMSRGGRLAAGASVGVLIALLLYLLMTVL